MRWFLFCGWVYFFVYWLWKKKLKFFFGFDFNYYFFKLECKFEGCLRKMIDVLFFKMFFLFVELVLGKGVRMKYFFIWGYLRWGYLWIIFVMWYVFICILVFSWVWYYSRMVVFVLEGSEILFGVFLGKCLWKM